MPLNIALYVSHYGFALEDAAGPGPSQSSDMVAVYALGWLVLALGGPLLTALLLRHRRMAPS